MRHSFGEKVFYFVMLVSLLMTNPPVLTMVNDYCKVNPLTWSFPTMWLWLEAWYCVMIVDFLIAAFTIRAWNCSQDSKLIDPTACGQDD